jgi:hypothetical protein
MISKKYVIVATIEQVKEIQLALGILARLRCGQIHDALQEMKDSGGRNHKFDWDTIRKIEEIVKPELHLSFNELYGIGKFEDADAVWDMYETIRYRLSHDSLKEGEIPPSFDVRFDPPMHWNTKVPQITIEPAK